jgi:hypothetical protein
MIWRRSDELFRRLMLDISAISFWAFEGALFLWAAGQQLGLLPAVSAWQAFIVLFAAYLAASMAISARRGLA